MTREEKLKLIYMHQKGLSNKYPDFNVWCEKVEKEWSEEEIDMKCQFAMYNLNATENLHKMMQENSYSLIKNGISDDDMDFIFEKKMYPCNMDGRVEEMVFILETLRLFRIYEYELSINNIKKIGGGYYSDGEIYGYNIIVNGHDKYSIVIDKEKSKGRTKGTKLSLGTTDNTDFLEEQRDMLEKFVNFTNAATISRLRSKIARKLEEKNGVRLV